MRGALSILVFVFAAQASLADASRTPLESAQAALEAGDLATAESLFAGVAADHPEIPQGHRGLAEVRIAQGRYREAASILLFLGDGFAGIGLYEDAIEVLEEAVRWVPDAPRLRASLGRALMLEGKRFGEAEQHLEQAAKGRDVDLATWLYLAAARWELGRLDEAEAVYRELLASHPESAPIQYQLARLLLAEGEPEEALPWLRKAAERQPDDVELQTDLGRVADGQGDVDGAEAAFRRAIALDQSYKKAHYGLARLLARQGRRDEAEAAMEVYRRLTEEEHDRVRALELEQQQLAQAWALLRRGEAEVAAEHFRSFGEQPEALRGLAAAQAAQGLRRDAVRTLERAVEAAPNRPDLQLLLVEARLAREPSNDG